MSKIPRFGADPISIDSPTDAAEVSKFEVLSCNERSMQTQNEKASKRSCLFMLILVFVVLPFSLVALGLMLWYGRESSGNRLLAARKSSITKQGLPIDDASLDQFFKDRTDPTNAAAWKDIFATMETEDFKTSLNGVAILSGVVEERIVPDHEWKAESASLAFLEKWKSLHAEVVQLSIDAKPVRFPTVFDSFKTLLTEVQELRQVARLLELQGRVGLRARNSTVVRENVDSMLGLSQVPTGYPILVSQLVVIAIDGIAMGLLKDAIEYDVLNEADLQLLLPKVLVAVYLSEDWRATIAGERGIALPIFTDPKKARALGVSSFPSRSRDALLYLNLSDKVMEIPIENLAELKAKLHDFELEVEKIAKVGLLAQFDSIMTMQTLPSWRAAGDAFIRRALQHRIAAIAMGLRLYEDRHASLPKSLDALSEIPLDFNRLVPTNNTSFGYRKEGGNAKLWGGSYNDPLTIAVEPHAAQTENDDSFAKYSREFWLWELPAMKK